MCVGQQLLCVHTPVPFSIHTLLTFTLQKEAKAFLSAKLEWFPPHRHGINVMQSTGPGTENILKHLWFGLVFFLFPKPEKAFVVGMLLKGFFACKSKAL